MTGGSRTIGPRGAARPFGCARIDGSFEDLDALKPGRVRIAYLSRSLGDRVVLEEGMRCIPCVAEHFSGPLLR
jgi:hypothetical protein